MAMVLVEASPETANAGFAATQLGVPVEAIDQDFGLILVDPSQGLYTVMVDARSLPPGFADRTPFRGPFSTPRIEPL